MRFIEEVKETSRQNSVAQEQIQDIKEKIMDAAKKGSFFLTIPDPVLSTEVKNYLKSEGFHVYIDEYYNHKKWMHISWNE